MYWKEKKGELALEMPKREMVRVQSSGRKKGCEEAGESSLKQGW